MKGSVQEAPFRTGHNLMASNTLTRDLATRNRDCTQLNYAYASLLKQIGGHCQEAVIDRHTLMGSNS